MPSNFNGLFTEALKTVSATFLLICFVSLIKRVHMRNQILSFQIFICHDVIKYPNMNQETKVPSFPPAICEKIFYFFLPLVI